MGSPARDHWGAIGAPCGLRSVLHSRTPRLCWAFCWDWGLRDPGNRRTLLQVCGKSFNRMYNLLGHMHLHAGSKPFKCPYCSSKFNLKGNLSRHMKVKHGVMDISLDSQGRCGPCWSCAGLCVLQTGSCAHCWLAAGAGPNHGAHTDAPWVPWWGWGPLWGEQSRRAPQAQG